MRKLFYLIVIVSFFSCDQTNTKQQKSATTPTQKESKYKKLLTKYKDLSFDTLKVFSSDDLESKKYKFKGKRLDSSEVLLLPKELSEQYINDNGYFACFKFPIDSIRTGLITRTPSTYEPSSVKLLILDIQEDRITDFIELAETFGDAGDMAEKTSWLFKDNNKKYKAFMWYEESHDNSAEDEKDTTVQTWDYYYLLDISKSKADTVSKDEKELIRRYGNLIKH